MLAEEQDKCELIIVEKERISRIQFNCNYVASTDDSVQDAKNLELEQRCQYLAQCLLKKQGPQKQAPKNPFKKEVNLKALISSQLTQKVPVNKDGVKVTEPLLALFVFYRFYVN